MRCWRICLLAACQGLGGGASLADAPYRPTDDGVVLELLASPRLAGAASIRELRDQWRMRPTHVATALAYARAAVEVNRRDEDPRYLGYAEAALAPWWTLRQAPPEVVLLRASLRLARQEFAQAERDLQDLIASPAPEAGAAHLTRATLRLGQGDPQAAQVDCLAAQPTLSDLVAATCFAAVRGLRGEAASGLGALEAALLRASDAPLSAELWARAVAADLACRSDDGAQALVHFERGVQRMASAGSVEPGLLAGFADFLLARGEARRVQSLLAPFHLQDSLVLRLALAERQLARAGDRVAATSEQAHARYLGLRFQEMRQRGDRSHLHEQALFELDLMADPAASLRSMAQAWSMRREPVDALLYLRAARAAGKPEAAAAVRAWISTTGLKDARLEAAWARPPVPGP